MILRFVDVSEYILLYSFKKESFSYINKNENWDIDDFILYIIDKKIAALAKVISKKEDAFDIHFIHIIEPSERPTISGKFRDELILSFGIEFELSLFNQSCVVDEKASFFIDFFDDFHNSLHYYFTEIDYLFEEEEKLELKKQHLNKENKKFSKLTESISIPKESSTHTKLQHYLKEIGRITGCDTWMASNDQNREYNGDKLGDDTLEHFPSFQIDDEVKKRISLIDTIWFKNQLPVCAFEVETTTTVYSGILRMGDLVSVMPSINMKLYIVAPNERKEKVLREMNRPVFKRIGLTDYCKFLPLESLEILLEKIKGLDGYILPEVLEAIAITP